MFLLKIFYFLKGYAIISIKGTGAARFVNILHARGVPVWNADAGHASVFARDLDAAAGAAKKAGVQVEVLRLCSLRDVFFRRSGWVFALCAAIFMLFWAISAGYVWSIETEGADADTAAQSGSGCASARESAICPTATVCATGLSTASTASRGRGFI